MSGYKWVRAYSGSPLPHDAVRGGTDVDSSTLYVGRAYHEGDMLPAKVRAGGDVAYVCHGGQEHPKYDFWVLCPADFGWKSGSHGSVPSDAVVAGNTADGETLYVGRVLHNGAQTIGKIQPSHGCLYIPFDGEELSFTEYEVLIVM